MNFNKTVKYNLKRVLPILGIAGATLLPACRGGQNEPEQKTEPVVQKHDTTLWFYFENYDAITPEKVNEKLSDPAVANVYLTVEGTGFTRGGPVYMAALRNKKLEPAINVDSTRVFGRGDFILYPGQIHPEDSLWLVSKGWTIKHKQR